MLYNAASSLRPQKMCYLLHMWSQGHQAVLSQVEWALNSWEPVVVLTSLKIGLRAPLLDVTSHTVIAKELASTQFRVVHHLKVHCGAVRDTVVWEVLLCGGAGAKSWYCIEIPVPWLWVLVHSLITWGAFIDLERDLVIDLAFLKELITL